MIREQNLFQILKFETSFIMENDLNIKNYSIKDAVKASNIVSVGDNIAFDQIRKLRGDKRTSRQIFYDVEKARRDLKEARLKEDWESVGVINLYIRSTLFVKDVISVHATKKSEYRKIAKHGFYVNGAKYVRFSASAGQIRHDTVLFCNAEIYPQLFKILMCGLDERVEAMNIAKLSAYFSLSTSSVMWVSEPRVCIIKDFNTTLKDQKIDWIINDENGKKSVEERTIDVTMNSCDGQGLIDPTMAKKWSTEIGLDYVASSYVTRTIFTKGNLVPFDFREYAHRNGIDTITDRWGKTYPIDEIDVLISESQFKMYKYYKSWQEYLDIAHENGIKWGVARYNKKVDAEWSLTNYQYIQIMNINDEDIRELIQPTIDWINKVCSGDPLYAMLYSMGGFGMDEELYYAKLASRAQSTAMQAVSKNIDFLQDSFVQRKIYSNIVESINQAKLGKIWMHGNYQFMISDPIAQCRSALGLDPTGEIPAEHVYSRWWLDRGRGGQKCVFLRSPCLDKHEANPCTIYDSEEASYWYKWIQSGYIYSIYDLSTLRHSDSDSKTGSVGWRQPIATW